jgi:hypothetical protein
MGVNVTGKNSDIQTVAVLDTTAPQIRMPAAKQPKTKDNSSSNTTADNKFSVAVIRSLDGLKEHLEAWQSLSENSIEPNIFYEPLAMIPAVEFLSTDEDLYFVFVYATDPLRPFGAKILCGFFPLQYSGHYKKMPVSVLRLWKHSYCFLCTPLLREGSERETLQAFFDWLESSESPAQLMEFASITGDGVFRKLLIDELNQRALLAFSDNSYNRALFKPNSGEGISGRHKKELRRQQNRLSEEGRLEYFALEKEADVETWLNDFIQLEAKGWKGLQGSAFASQETSEKFFKTVAKQAFAKDQLIMMALRLDGKPIAMKCNFLSQSGAFAFKIAFDENFARYSPGVLLELENMQRINAMPKIEWMDSCAVSEHFMINRLWTKRRTIETLLCSTGKAPADFLVSVLPLMRWFKRKISRKRAKQEKE